MTTAIKPTANDRFILFAGHDMIEPPKPESPKFSRFEKEGKSVLGITDVPVFRSGSFRDSMGFPHEYDDFAIDTFVRNFDHLTNQKILPDIPVRKGHPSFGTNRMDGLIGYVTALRTQKRTAPHDGNEYLYLLADFEILDDDAAKNIESGLWRNRSSEVGVYADNRDQEYAPTFMGVAYVDIPAVEGLNGFSADQNLNTHFMMEEPAMGPVVTPPAPGTTPAPAFAFQIDGQTVTDYSAVQEFINATLQENKNLTAEIEPLRAYQRQTVEAGREAFVSQLIEDKKILASQKDSLVALAKGLDTDQFETWRKSYDNAAPIGLLDEHGHQNGGAPSNVPSAEDIAKKADFDANVEIVRGLVHLPNMTDERVKQSGAYQRVIAADPTFQL